MIVVFLHYDNVWSRHVAGPRGYTGLHMCTPAINAPILHCLAHAPETTLQPARCTVAAPAAFDKLAETIVYYHVFNSCPFKSFNLRPSVVYMILTALKNKVKHNNKTLLLTI